MQIMFLECSLRKVQSKLKLRDVRVALSWREFFTRKNGRAAEAHSQPAIKYFREKLLVLSQGSGYA